MAGTLAYELRVAHTFQRRFDNEEIAEAMGDCHLYIISRRPALRIAKESIRAFPEQIQFEVLIQDRNHAEQFILPVDGEPYASDFRVHDDGAYFSFRRGPVVLHGDSWSLASLCSAARTDIAGHEVMYIGKAFGPTGGSNAWRRTKHHEPLQRIYEEHVGGPDIFVTPLRIVDASLHAVDHIEDPDPAVSLDRSVKNYFWDASTSRETVHSIDLIEHALIAYFTPPYNEKLIEWRSDKPTNAMRHMRRVGIRLLHVHLNGVGGLIRFRSRRAPRATRSHLILHDLPPEPRRPVLRGISAIHTESWRSRMFNVDDPEPVLAEGERAHFALQVFGDRAPRVRRPASVDLDAIKDEYARMDQLRADLQKLPEGAIPPPDQLFVEGAGTVRLGQSVKDHFHNWQLFDAEGHPQNGIIIGPAGYGKSNCLNVVTLGAIQSGRLLIWAADCQRRHLGTMRAWFKARQAGCLAIDWLAGDFTELHRQLAAACAIIEHRAVNGPRIPRRESAGILLTIEDAHQVFNARPDLTPLAQRVAVEGPANGLCLVATMPDGNIARFGGSAELRKAISASNRIVFGAEDALLAFDDFADD